jgi:hypothetical protein
MDMQEVFLSLEKYQGLFYLLLLLAGMYAFRRLWKAWKEWREAYFGLEREIAVRRLAQWLAAAVLILLLMCGVFAIATFVVPSLPASDLIATPTLDLLATPSAALPADQTALMALTPIVAASAAGSQGCVPGQLEITSPKPGAEISGTITLVGTVNVPNFGFYKYELTLRGMENWAPLSAERKVKINEELGILNTSVLTPGDYLLRLVVVDTAGISLPPCIISLRIKGQ